MWFYLTMTDQFRLNPKDNRGYFVFRKVEPTKRDSLYNLTLALQLPVQTLGLIEALVATELADFTIFDQQLCPELDPRLPNQQENIDLAANLYELTRDIESSL